MTNSPPPPSTKRARRSAVEDATGDVVQHDDRRTREIVGRQRVGVPGGDLEPGRLANRQRSGQVQAAVSRRAGALGEDHPHRFLRRDDEVEHVVALERVLRQPHRCAHVALGNGDRLEGRRRRSARLDVDPLRLNAAPAELQRQVHVSRRGGPVIHDAGRHGYPLLVRERRALQAKPASPTGSRHRCRRPAPSSARRRPAGARLPRPASRSAGNR